MVTLTDSCRREKNLRVKIMDCCKQTDADILKFRSLLLRVTYAAKAKAKLMF